MISRQAAIMVERLDSDYRIMFLRVGTEILDAVFAAIRFVVRSDFELKNKQFL